MGARWHQDGWQVSCLTDGQGSFAPEVFPELSEIECKARLAAAGEADIRTEFNAFLIEGDGVLTLVDAGYGALAGAKGGRVLGLLADMGVAPAQIGRLVFTHLHGDHCGGALGDGGLVFPNAEVVMHPAEAQHWQGSDTPGGRVLAALGGRIRLLDDGQEVAPGLTFWHLPGHTPGHSGLRVGNGLVLVADIVHSEALQLQDPHCCTKYDVDPALARETRRRAMDEVAQRGLVCAGGHLLGPDKFARLVVVGQGYAKVAP